MGFFLSFFSFFFLFLIETNKVKKECYLIRQDSTVNTFSFSSIG